MKINFKKSFKNNVGFTLVELLAIIVILAIIAVITVPIILNVIENSRKGAATNSAYGFIDSFSTEYLTGLMLNSDQDSSSGTFVMMANKNLVDGDSHVLTATVSGNFPDENSWIELLNGKVVAYSLKFGDYVVTKYADTDAVTVKGNTIAENTAVRDARLEVERQMSAIASARAIVDNESGTTGITDISEGWVAFINGSLKVYSVSVVVGDYTYIVTDTDVDSSNSNAVASRVLTTVSDRSVGEQAILNYYSGIVSTKASNYISALLENSTIQAYSEDTSNFVSEISTPSAPTGIDSNSWIYFKKETSSVSASDYSLKFTEGGYTFVVNCVDGVVASPELNGTLLPQKMNIAIIIKRGGTPLTSGQTIDLGDTVTLKHGSSNDGFVVIEVDSVNHTATLLADNNIDTSTFFQGPNGSSYEVAFASTNYWQNYASDMYDPNRDKAPGNGDYSVAYYVKGYVSNLRNIGFTLVQETGARILRHYEISSGGIAESYKTSGEKYWLSSVCASNYLWRVAANGSVSDSTYYGGYGVRPVIVISTVDL